MNNLSQEELQNLTAPQDGWCVSIYIPTIVKGQEVRQNPIRFKNMLDEAEQKLQQASLSAKEIDSLLAPAQAILVDSNFWQQQNQGLVVFIRENLLEHHRLPIEVEETCLVGDHFYLKPLLTLLNNDEEFYILALSQNATRFLRASQYEVEPVEVPGMPSSMDDALPDVTSEKQIQFHTMTSQPGGRGGERDAMYFGHGQGEEDRDKNLLNYFRRVNEAVVGYLRDQQAPLLLAGVKYLLPIYKEANTYQHLMDDIIPGNPEDISDQDLRDEGWKMVSPLFQTEKERISGQYKQLSGGNDQRAVKDLKEVVKAAPFGRVEVLFIDKNARQWGTFDANNVEVRLEEDAKPGAHDLIDFAAVQTLLHGGTVFAVDGDELPDEGSPVAAIFRY